MNGEDLIIGAIIGYLIGISVCKERLKPKTQQEIEEERRKWRNVLIGIGIMVLVYVTFLAILLLS